MVWQLSPGVGFCAVDVQLIFFDLKTDRYFALGGVDRRTFQAMREGREPSAEDAARLVSAGLVVRADGKSNLDPPSVTIPQDDLSSWDDSPSSIRGVALAAVSLAWSKRAARRSRIARTVSALTRRKRQLTVPVRTDAVIDTAVHFATCRPLVPIARRCLIDSLALMHLLLSRKQSASLVFGVRTDPFAAHCWVQGEHHILTCAADDALGFTPIMVL